MRFKVFNDAKHNRPDAKAGPEPGLSGRTTDLPAGLREQLQEEKYCRYVAFFSLVSLSLLESRVVWI